MQPAPQPAWGGALVPEKPRPSAAKPRPRPLIGRLRVLRGNGITWPGSVVRLLRPYSLGDVACVPP